jgi:hypothetical protein
MGRGVNQAVAIHTNLGEHSMADPIEHVIVLMMEKVRLIEGTQPTSQPPDDSIYAPK